MLLARSYCQITCVTTARAEAGCNTGGAGSSGAGADGEVVGHGGRYRFHVVGDDPSFVCGRPHNAKGFAVVCFRRKWGTCIRAMHSAEHGTRSTLHGVHMVTVHSAWRGSYAGAP